MPAWVSLVATRHGTYLRKRMEGKEKKLRRLETAFRRLQEARDILGEHAQYQEEEATALYDPNLLDNLMWACGRLDSVLEEQGLFVEEADPPLLRYGSRCI